MPRDDSLIIDALRLLLMRDLRALDREIAAYPDDASMWLTPPGVSNSGGALVQHLNGNIRHFFGNALGQTGYIRNRDAEFSERTSTREELRAEVHRTIDDVNAALDRLTPEILDSAFPLRIQDHAVNTANWVLHLAVHLGYHLGQIDYHRRLLTGSTNPIGAQSVSELFEQGTTT